MFIRNITLIGIFPILLVGQVYVEADPMYLLSHEKLHFQTGITEPTLIRPFFNLYTQSNNTWYMRWRSDLFVNNSAPNLENTSNLWVGKGLSLFSSLNVSYANRFVAFSIEPFIFYNQNQDYNEPVRFMSSELSKKRPQTALTDSTVWKFSRLNDMRAHSEVPYKDVGFRETQLFLHYRYVGIGFSNTNLWWGPGFHSSLIMTNNTTGFPHVMMGTLRDFYIKNFSVNARYFFAELNKEKNAGQPYFTAIVFSATYHSEPVITIGFSRLFLSGGILTEETISLKEALLLPFKLLVKEKLVKDPTDPTSSGEEWDQTLAGYVNFTFPKSGLKIYLEYGQNDARWDWYDFRGNPEHAAASLIGFRKYGLFKNDNLVMGFEYTNLIKARFWFARKMPLWYGRYQFDYSSYDGRYFGAHSGPDSDDMTIYFGYLGDKFAIIPAFNYERHGVIAHPLWPETKFEYRLDCRYKYKGYQLSLYFEREFIENYEFKNHETKWSTVIFLGIERGLSLDIIPWLNK